MRLQRVSGKLYHFDIFIVGVLSVVNGVHCLGCTYFFQLGLWAYSVPTICVHVTWIFLGTLIVCGRSLHQPLIPDKLANWQIAATVSEALT